ncbi:type II toxin-antitoxin system VapB family antitoxin [Sandaracinobacteroides saxicola]|uniref:Type II toxin-antitoxin system VapB family antitoxin n=1 Tax=Sandaracinobacteroides saxicola TaxID=2759707 RepID=A0A7G5IHC6_9SPHN|nr:type II toxin-antitoxin system VapB family antitoxin [Sandaracinobacteroides saxicola]QMW22768.1 type II toxin-antitoxin system VapB family antitoxin [Sandaracinobacteroides saxicola]
MGRQLNIKHDDAWALAERLSRKTGESMTDAVVVSLRERLARLEGARQAEVEAKLAALRAMASSIQADLRPDAMTAEQFDAWMYDDQGLPH